MRANPPDEVLIVQFASATPESLSRMLRAMMLDAIDRISSDANAKAMLLAAIEQPVSEAREALPAFKIPGGTSIWDALEWLEASDGRKDSPFHRVRHALASAHASVSALASTADETNEHRERRREAWSVLLRHVPLLEVDASPHRGGFDERRLMLLFAGATPTALNVMLRQALFVAAAAVAGSPESRDVLYELMRLPPGITRDSHPAWAAPGGAFLLEGIRASEARHGGAPSGRRLRDAVVCVQLAVFAIRSAREGVRIPIVPDWQRGIDDSIELEPHLDTQESDSVWAAVFDTLMAPVFSRSDSADQIVRQVHEGAGARGAQVAALLALAAEDEDHFVRCSALNLALGNACMIRGVSAAEVEDVSGEATRAWIRERHRPRVLDSAAV